MAEDDKKPETLVARLIDRVEPYWKLVSIAGAAVSALIVGVAWAAAYFATEAELKQTGAELKQTEAELRQFATEAELKQLACTSDTSLLLKSLPVYSFVLTSKMDSAWVELEQLKKGGANEDDRRVQEIRVRIIEFREQRKSADAKYQDLIDNSPKKCVAP
jgi:hypothetical protein